MADFVHIDMIGATRLRGKFASMGGEMQAIMIERAAVMAQTLEGIYKERAPQGEYPLMPSRTERFEDSIHGESIPVPMGYSVSVTTTQPDVRGYIFWGRPTVHASPGKSLHWLDKDGSDVFRKSAGPVDGRPEWEGEAEGLALTVATYYGHIIAARVKAYIDDDIIVL